MSDRLSCIEARLGEIDQALAAVLRRIDALESREVRAPDASPGAMPAAAGAGSAPPLLALGHPDVSGLVSLLGRTFVVFGGAFLLRALTESGQVQGRAGVFLGFAYAAAWFGAADRAGVTRPLSGLFHGLTAVVISLPLLWEASTRFGLLSPGVSAVTLFLITGLALGVAWHRRLESLAGVAVMGSIAVAAGLVFATARPLPFAVGLVALGGFTLWLDDARGWSWLRWPPAWAANLLALGLLARASGAAPIGSRGAVIALLVALFATYAGWVAWRTLANGHRVQASEVFQTGIVVIIGLLGALMVARDGPRFAWSALGGASLLGGAACYSAAFGILKRRSDARANVVFFATLAVTLVIIGCGAILSGPARIAVYGGLAVLTAALAVRMSEPELSLHATALSLAMASASAALIWETEAWLTSGPWPPLGAAHVATFAVAAACLAIPPPASSVVTGAQRTPVLVTIARFVVAVVLAIGLGGIVVSWVGPFIAADAGILASVRTAVLAVSAIGVAALARIRQRAELGWLVYPVLVVGGLKLLADDFIHSSAATLFASLAIYGVALILAPRIARRS